MQKSLTIIILLLANFVFSQGNSNIKIELKDNHYSRYSSVLITKDEKHFITSDVTGKITQKKLFFLFIE